jgi:hypothetical protein
VLNRAVDELTDEPEHEIAARTLAEIPMRRELLAARCAELPILLAKTLAPGALLEWSV